MLHAQDNDGREDQYMYPFMGIAKGKCCDGLNQVKGGGTMSRETLRIFDCFPKPLRQVYKKLLSMTVHHLA